MPDKGPVLVVAACIVDKDRVLLACRNQPSVPDAHGKWELPGGKVDFGESPQEAVRREIREELGVDVQVVRLLPHLQNNVYKRPGRDDVHSVVVAFECVLPRGVVRPQPKEPSVSAIRWTPRQSLDQLDLLPGTAEFVESLDRLDHGTVDSPGLHVHLRRHRTNASTDNWDIYCGYDLLGSLTLVEVHRNTDTRSTHTKVTRDLVPDSQVSTLTKRIRSLASHGYAIINASDARLAAGLGGRA